MTFHIGTVMYIFPVNISHFSQGTRKNVMSYKEYMLMVAVCVCWEVAVGVCVFRVYVLLLWESIFAEIKLNPQENDFSVLRPANSELIFNEKYTLYTYVKR